MNLRLDSIHTNLGVKQQPQAGTVSKPSASLPISENVPTVKASAALLRSQVLFGSSYEPQYPKLTYHKLETIADPMLGDIEVYQFSNGMKFYGLQRDDVPLVALGEVVKAGSVQEKASENGVSHFLEHLIFKGSKFLKAGEFDRLTENLGGQINAFTSYDQTFYYTYDLPKDALREAIKLRAEFLQNAQVPQVEMDKERTTVISEIGMYKGEPDSVIWEKTAQSVWGDSPLRRSILGPKGIIASIPRDVVMNYYHRFYAPENRAIIVAGDFNMKEALEAVAEEFNIPFPAQTARNNKKVLPPLSTENEHTLERKIENAKLYVAFDGPRNSANDPKTSMALDIATYVLGGDRSSRLYQRIVEGNQWAYAANATFYETQTRSMFILNTEGDPAHLDKIKTAMREELEKIAKDGITEAELKKAFKNLRKSLIDETETLRSLTGSLAKVVSGNEFASSYGQRLKLMENLTSQDVQDAVKAYLNPANAQVITMLPKKPRVQKIDVRFSGSLRPQDTSKLLANGAEVLFHSRPKSVLNSLVIKIKGGKSLQTAPAQAALLAKMIGRGTINYDAKAFQALQANNAMYLGASAEDDTMTLGIEVNRQDTQAMLDLMKELLQNGPAFRQSDLDFVKKMTRREILGSLDGNATLYAMGLVNTHLYPEGHPYRGTTELALANLDNITLDELKSLYQKMFQPQNMTLTMAGPGNPDAFAQEAESWLKNLKNDGPSLKTQVVPQPPALTQNVLATRAVKSVKEMPLSEIVRGWHAPGLNSKELATLSVLNGVLRAGMSSRLFQTFREGEHGGLCYSVSSGNQSNLHAGTFYFYIGTEHKNVPLVLDLFQKEVDKLVNTTPSEEEMMRAKNLIGSGILSAEQRIYSVASSLGNHRLLNTPSNWDLMPEIQQVTAQDVQAFAQKYLAKPSVTAIAAPKSVLRKYKLPINGDKPLNAGQTI